jgi:hypothetical protein
MQTKYSEIRQLILTMDIFSPEDAKKAVTQERVTLANYPPAPPAPKKLGRQLPRK